ncbi:MAG TPA: phage portal protein, partial [Clostridia bacterium]|nr:phage portal protein [Clostridia bacterium]
MSVEMTGLFGRRQIFTSETDINKSNIAKVLQEALKTHSLNKTDIEYLKNYVKGDQPILSRVKEIRPEINFKTVENHAYEIVSFKTGYVFGAPISLVQRGKLDIKNGNEK